MKIMVDVRRYRSIVYFVAFFLSSCALLGGYNATSHEQLTSLKAMHLKFIDTFTQGDEKSFDKKRFAKEIDEIDLKFREALEFSKSIKGDSLRTGNLELLKEIFLQHVTNIKEKLKEKKSRLVTEKEAKRWADRTSQAYDLAIKGECARPEGRCR